MALLKRIYKQLHYGKKGFTLIELLVVVAILGVLAAVAIPNISKFIGSGNLAAANTELAAVQTAQSAYMADHGNTPDLTVTAGGGVSSYIDRSIKGAYTFDSAGKLSAASYANLSYDTAAMQFSQTH